MTKVGYFTDCKCPKCRKPMDAVLESEERCPYCNAEIDFRSVWLTESGSGNIPLPRWLEKNIIPFLGLLCGIAFTAFTHFFLGIVFLKASGAIIGFSLAYIAYNLLSSE